MSIRPEARVVTSWVAKYTLTDDVSHPSSEIKWKQDYAAQFLDYELHFSSEIKSEQDYTPQSFNDDYYCTFDQN